MQTIEKPGSGRAVITESFKQTRIDIPSQKKLFLLIGPVSYMVLLWIMWGKQLVGLTPQGKIWVDYSQWPILLFTAFGVLTFLNQLWWMLLGKEIIIAGNGILTIQKKAQLLSFRKSYNLNEARLFRTEYYNEKEGDQTERFAQNITNFGNYGIICFEYGAKTVRFGEGLSEAEGDYILKKLRDNEALTEQNFI